MLENSTHILFWVALGSLLVGALFLMSATLLNVFRLRNVRLSWKAGKLKGYPLFATLFLLFAVTTAFFAVGKGTQSEAVIAYFFVGFGTCWFISSFLTTKYFITDHGIVKNVNAPAQTVPWHQIRDFVEREEAEHICYVFLYDAQDGDPVPQLIRLELQVPVHLKEPFQKLISHKLGRRIRCYMDEEVNVQQFDQRQR